MKDYDKVKVAAALLIAGFVGGVFVANKSIEQAHYEYKSSPQPANPNNGGEATLRVRKKSGGGEMRDGVEREGEQKQANQRDRNGGGGGGKINVVEDGEEEQKPAKASPFVLTKSDAIRMLVGNTIIITPEKGREVYIYISPRGLIRQGALDLYNVTVWGDKGGAFCQPASNINIACQKIQVTLARQEGLVNTVTAVENALKVYDLPEGAKIGEVAGFGSETAVLYRGNTTNFPDYVPFLDDIPTLSSVLFGTPAQEKILSGVIGRPLATSFWVADRTNTLYLPKGGLIEVDRMPETLDMVRVWAGKWSRKNTRVCREIPPTAEQKAMRLNPDLAQKSLPLPATECSTFSTTQMKVNFPESPEPYRRNYIYSNIDAHAGKKARERLYHDINSGQSYEPSPHISHDAPLKQDKKSVAAGEQESNRFQAFSQSGVDRFNAVEDGRKGPLLTIVSNRSPVGQASLLVVPKAYESLSVMAAVSSGSARFSADAAGGGSAEFSTLQTGSKSLETPHAGSGGFSQSTRAPASALLSLPTLQGQSSAQRLIEPEVSRGSFQ